jgi:hypothetical protein
VRLVCYLKEWLLVSEMTKQNISKNTALKMSRKFQFLSPANKTVCPAPFLELEGSI